MSTQDVKFGSFEAIGMALIMVFSLLLVYLSYFMELEAWRSILGRMNYPLPLPEYFGHITMAQVFSFTFNGAKIALVFIIAFYAISRLTPIAEYLMRFSLIAYSLLMSLLIISTQMISPNLEESYQKQIDRIEQRFSELQINAELNLQKQLDKQTESYREDVAEANAHEQPWIQKAQDGMAYQRTVVVNREFIGKQYIEWERQSKNHQDSLDKKLDQLRQARDDRSTVISNEFQNRMRALDDQKAAALTSLSIEDQMGAFEAQNPLVVSLIGLLNKTVFSGDSTINIYHMTLIITLLVSFNIEFVPLLLLKYSFSRLFALNTETETDPASAGSGAQRAGTTHQKRPELREVADIDDAAHLG